MKRAGLSEIPRPFDNMRMTRSNEVYNRWGAFKESQWIGHSSRVRADHYLMITDADFLEATATSAESSTLFLRVPSADSVNGVKNCGVLDVYENSILPPYFPPQGGGKGLQGVENGKRTNRDESKVSPLVSRVCNDLQSVTRIDKKGPKSQY